MRPIPGLPPVGDQGLHRFLKALKEAIEQLGRNASVTTTSIDSGGGGSTPSGSAEWGAITGTLSDQTDLQTALNGKADAALGVTNGNSHDHSGGDGAQIAYSGLSGLPTLGGSASLNVGTTAGTVAAGDHLHTGVYQPAGSYEPANANIQTHISSTSNPHGTTADQVLPSQTGQSGKFLTTNGTTSSWDTVPVGVTDHGALTGLADDDHTQYHNDARGDARYSLLGHNHSGTYEPVISAGTTGQYWRGDKSWQTLDKAAVGLSNVENTALSTWAGSANITTVGTIATGTWNATEIGVNKGGTGLTSLGSANRVLGVNAAGSALEYKAITAGANVTVTHSAGGIEIASSGSTSATYDWVPHMMAGII
jgi:hypothetical protein